MSESLILFDQENYKQNHEVQTINRIIPTLVIRTKTCQDWTLEFKLAIYVKCIDDTFLIFFYKYHNEKL